MAADLDYLSFLNTARIRLLEVEISEFIANGYSVSGVAESSRLILCESGTMPYRAGERIVRLTPGKGLLLPAGTRREWMVPPGGHCKLRWFSYCTKPAKPVPRQALVRTIEDPLVEFETVERLWTLYRRPSPEAALEMEMEAKAALARFITHARPISGDDPPSIPQSEAGIQRSVEWMKRHLAEEDVLARAHEKSGLSLPYYRVLFRRTTGKRPAEFLLQCRLRQALRLLHEQPDWPVKRVAGEVGFRDPLYFTRTYQRFWGRSPTEERGQARASNL